MTEETIFHEALGCPSREERDAFVARACGGDESLFSRVRGLLRAHDSPDAYLARQAGGQINTLDFQPVQEQVGSAIGSYKLLEQIGEGGMGVVYVAEQTEPVRRRVALKIIKPGMDTKQVIFRFEAERQALAMMDHPNIAKIYDAGTVGPVCRTGPEAPNDVPMQGPARQAGPTGRPYFVMELVRGLAITEYCDKARLSPRQRLELVIDVCHAVQHAHQKGIIHRDLKPSNVTITVHDGRPIPKVIDFGVAKAVGQQLTERTVYTAHTQLVGTPLYMSPEQADFSSQDVDTRSDVYSLGVLLYELLTGQTPFDEEALHQAGFDEMRRIIREDDPPRPSHRISTLGAQASSTVSQQRGVDERHLSWILCGELDWIVMKALEKDRTRRYESASALAADIQRYLSDEPVLACPPTTMYRFQKFARKHKAAFTTAAAIAACLILGTTVSAWQAVRATSAEARAETNAQQADQKAKEATKERDEAQKQRDEVKALADKLVAKEEQLQRTLYADHIHMAQTAWETGDVRAMSDLLAQHVPNDDEPDRRNFEWHYLNRLAHIGPLLSIKTGPGLYGRNLKLSSDRTRLIRFQPARTPSRNRNETTPATPPRLQAWNVETGQEIFAVEISGIPDRTASGWQPRPEFTPDNAYLVLTAIGWDPAAKKPVPGDLRIWSTQTGKEIFKQDGVVEDVLFSPENKLLAIPLENESVKLTELQTDRERLTLPGQPKRPDTMAFSPDGKRLAAAYQKWDETKKAIVEGEIKIWDTQTGDQLKSFQGQLDLINALVFSPDGRQLVTAVEGKVQADSGIKLWDSQTGENLLTIRWDAYVDDPVFNSDGTRLIAGGHKMTDSKTSERYTKLWNVQTGDELLSLKAGELQFSPDGKRVAYSDWRNFRTKVYDAQTGQIMLSVKDDGYGSIAFSPDSKRLATQSGGVHVWDLQNGEEINHIKVFDGHVLAFSQDGNRLIGSGPTSAQIWDAEIQPQSGKKIPLPGVGLVGFPADTPGVISSDFTRIAGISDKTVKLFDAQTGRELRTLTGHDQKVYAVALSQDGKRVASSDGPHPADVALGSNQTGGSVKVWDAETGKELFTIADLPHRIVRLKFSPDGQKLADSPADFTIKVWDAQSGRELFGLGRRLPNFPASAIAADNFAFSADGTRLTWQGKLFDAATGAELVTFKNAADVRGGTQTTAFSPDGKRVFGRTPIAKPAGDGTPPPSANCVWDAETGELLFTTPVLKGVGPRGRLTRSPDGKRLAGGGKIWDAQTGQFLLSLSSDDTGHLQPRWSPPRRHQ